MVVPTEGAYGNFEEQFDSGLDLDFAGIPQEQTVKP